MSRIFYAHSSEKTDKSDWQLLSNHLETVGRLAAKNAAYFDAEALAKNAGILHDIGKYSQEFQSRLEGGKKVDHATAGAQMAQQQWGKFGRLLAYIIAGHHVGLANGVDTGETRSTLTDRLKKSIPALDEIWKQEISLSDDLKFPAFELTNNFQGFQLAFLTRMLFSCVVDADYLDTEAFYLKLEDKQPRNTAYPSLVQFQQTLNQHLQQLTDKVSKNGSETVNHLRKEILFHSREQAVLEPGLFSLTVPTGGGKTLTSMAFALDHAIKYQLRRIIYVIPFTSIIEQNARVFRNIFSPLGDNVVLEHHSAFDDTGFHNQETKDKLRLVMENWDAPVIVTTAVQFFESLFADRTSKCRKLHNITGSVIILDEAQMLPITLLRPTMAAIDELAKNYKCSLVLCTATQPALYQPDFYGGFIVGQAKGEVREIAPNPAQLYIELERVTVRYIGIQTDDQLADKIKHQEQILIIVNNRRHARAIFDAVRESENVYHLTTLMCAKHRKKILDEIRVKLKSGQDCKVISTSLIEAGVDVDFPLVMRAETGLDSIAQAAGRCNREGLGKKEQSEVLIFTAPDWKAPPELEQNAASMRHVLRNYESNLLSPEAIKAYFSDVYWRKGEELDAKGLLKTHQDHYANLSFPFESIAKDYRIIENYMHPIIIPYDKEAEMLINKLRYTERVGSIPRKLQPYLVQVPEQAFIALKSAEAISPIQPERLAEQFWEMCSSNLYSERAGLDWSDPTYIDAGLSVF